MRHSGHSDLSSWHEPFGDDRQGVGAWPFRRLHVRHLALVTIVATSTLAGLATAASDTTDWVANPTFANDTSSWTVSSYGRLTALESSDVPYGRLTSRDGRRTVSMTSLPSTHAAARGLHDDYQARGQDTETYRQDRRPGARARRRGPHRRVDDVDELQRQQHMALAQGHPQDPWDRPPVRPAHHRLLHVRIEELQGSRHRGHAGRTNPYADTQSICDVWPTTTASFDDVRPARGRVRRTVARGSGRAAPTSSSSSTTVALIRVSSPGQTSSRGRASTPLAGGFATRPRCRSTKRASWPRTSASATASCPSRAGARALRAVTIRPDTSTPSANSPASTADGRSGRSCRRLPRSREGYGRHFGCAPTSCPARSTSWRHGVIRRLGSPTRSRPPMHGRSTRTPTALPAARGSAAGGS